MTGSRVQNPTLAKLPMMLGVSLQITESDVKSLTNLLTNLDINAYLKNDILATSIQGLLLTIATFTVQCEPLAS